MFVSLRMLTLAPDQLEQRDQILCGLQQAGQKLSGILNNWIAPILPQVAINGGHLVWRMAHATEAEALAAPHTHEWRSEISPLLEDIQLTAVGYRITRSRIQPAGPGIWRALVFRCFPHSPSGLVRELEEKTLLLPRYVSRIRSWALSPVAWTEGAKPFDFVWEQEFGEVADLTGPYMTTPVHWGIVDAFFDADCPEYIVDPQLIQVVGNIHQTIMA